MQVIYFDLSLRNGGKRGILWHINRNVPHQPPVCKTEKDLLIKVKWKFQNIEFEKKGIRNQAAEQFKIERAAGQGGV